MAAAVLLLAAPSHARAAGAPSRTTLAEGVGMVAKPSIRVRALQRALVSRGYSVGRSGIDGRFGPRTERAVRRFQADRHLAVDGIVGPRTRVSLRRATTATRQRTPARRTAHTARRSAAADRFQPARVGRADQAVRPSAVTAPLDLSTTPPFWRNPLVLGILAALVAAGGTLAVSERRRRARAARYRRVRLARRVPAIQPSLQRGPASPALLPVTAATGAAQGPAATASYAVDPERPGGGLRPQAPVIGYVTVRPELNGEVARSERAIEGVCRRDGLNLVDIVRDSDRGPLLERSGMARALERIAGGEACGLVVNDTRLLGRSIDLGQLLQRLRSTGAALVAVDLGVDTSTPQGRRVASALITMGGWGRLRAKDASLDGVADVRAAARWAGRLGVDDPGEVVAAHNGHAASSPPMAAVDERTDRG